MPPESEPYISSAGKWWRILETAETSWVEFAAGTAVVKCDMQWLSTFVSEQWEIGEDTAGNLVVPSKKNKQRHFHRMTLYSLPCFAGVSKLSCLEFLNGDTLDYLLENLRIRGETGPVLTEATDSTGFPLGQPFRIARSATGEWLEFLVENPAEPGEKLVVKCDKNWLEIVLAHSWKISGKRSKYIERTRGRGRFHVETVKTVEGYEWAKDVRRIKFLNRDFLDYRLCNLRRK